MFIIILGRLETQGGWTNVAKFVPLMSISRRASETA